MKRIYKIIKTEQATIQATIIYDGCDEDDEHPSGWELVF